MCFKEHSRIKLATINFLHTCTSWFYCMTSFLLGSIVWLSKIRNASMFPHFIPTQSSIYAFLEVGWKRRQMQKLLVRI
jgi:hypothetical protein